MEFEIAYYDITVQHISNNTTEIPTKSDEKKWKEKAVFIFPNVISPKVNVIEQLEFELTFFIVTVQHVSNYTTVSPAQNRMR